VTAFSDLIREYARALKAACGGQDRYVLAGMALGIKSRDWTQAAGQVHSFKRRPSWALP
jgi:hypothetical protein